MTATSQHSDTRTGPTAALPFPAVWLRDNCHCAACRDPRNGQKLFGIADVPVDVGVVDVRVSADTITVTFAPDGHRSAFSRAWLDAHAAQQAGDGRSERDKRLWSATDLDVRRHRYAWPLYRGDATATLSALRQVQQVGFAILTGSPTADGTVLDIAATFGFVRETNYGSLFDVRVEDNPNNLAFTGSGIGPHTDNPYRDPVPTLQLLHCLTNAVDGGESGLLDGFHAAALLREEDPTAFAVLTTTLVRFAWTDAATVLRADRPLIELDAAGQVREISFNNRSMQALTLPAEQTERFYAAYRAFAAIIARPELLMTFRLDPGDCVIFDNTRLLHARTAFAESGSRHLQGCYADLDSLTSTLSTLEAAR